MMVEKVHFSDVLSGITVIRPEGSARGLVPDSPSDGTQDGCDPFTPWDPHAPHHMCVSGVMTCWLVTGTWACLPLQPSPAGTLGTPPTGSPTAASST